MATDSIARVADMLMLQVSIYGCSIEEAWENHYGGFPTSYTFTEVKEFIDDKVALGERFQKEFGGL